eukprot:COSAG06_NODE_1321_length_9872_cov_11.153177_9_plen_83_part_00
MAQNRSVFEFSYVCPEPVLAKCSFLYIKIAQNRGVFRTEARLERKVDRVLVLTDEAQTVHTTQTTWCDFAILSGTEKCKGER